MNSGLELMCASFTYTYGLCVTKCDGIQWWRVCVKETNRRVKSLKMDAIANVGHAATAVATSLHLPAKTQRMRS